MRWYLVEAPSAHFAQTPAQPPNLKQKRQDFTGGPQMEPEEALSGQPGSHEGCVVSHGGVVSNVSQPHINGNRATWNTGTLLRVLLSCALLCVYFVLLGIGY